MLRAHLETYLSIHGLVVMLGLLLYVVVSHLTVQRRHPTAAIAWVLFIALMPYAAIQLFVAFGSRKQARPRSAQGQRLAPQAANGSWVLQTLHALGQPAPAAYRELNIHADGGQALDALLALRSRVVPRRAIEAGFEFAWPDPAEVLARRPSVPAGREAAAPVAEPAGA